MSERLVLDPADETTGRVEFDLTPFVGRSGPDFGEAQIEYYMAEAGQGSIPVDFRLPNRVVTIPLNLMPWGELSYQEVRASVQAKAGMWRREGGVLMREVDGVPLYLDVIGATLKMGGSTAQAMQQVDTDAVLTLETLPDWYGEEVDLGTETGAGEVVAVLDPAEGDHPGRTRIVVTDTDGVTRRGVMWALRHRHYSSATTAAPVYAAEDLTPADAAALATVTGSFGTQAVRHQSVGENWTPVLSTAVDGDGAMTHTGSYRILARVRAEASGMRCRLVWDVGDIVSPTQNRAAAVPRAGSWYVVDLGAVRLDRAPVGDHRWSGMIQAVSAGDAQTLSIDRVWLKATDDAAGSLTATDSGVTDPGLREFAGRDEFSQSSGNLSGKTAPTGTNWTTAGASTDFQVDGSGHVTRSAAENFRFGRLGSTLTAAVQQVDVKFDEPEFGEGVYAGVLARYSNTNNFLYATCNYAGPSFQSSLEVASYVGGSYMGGLLETPITLRAGVWYTIRIAVDRDGFIMAWVFPKGGRPGRKYTAWTADAATGGALASGYSGIIDGGTSTSTRYLDNFAAWEMEYDAAINSGRSLEIRTDGAFRATVDGAGAAPIVPVGDLPRMPPGGAEGRPAELLVKASRGDFASLPDPAADDISVQVFHRPSWLFVPRGLGS